MLKDKVVLITGATGMIGSSFATGVVKNRGKVIIGDISENKGVQLQEKLGKKNCIFFYVDVRSPESIDEFIRKGSDHFKKIDVAIHSAYPRSEQWGTAFENLKPENLAEDLFGQLGGAILFSQRIINFFIQQSYGNLIHVSSIQGVSNPKFNHYKGTKMISPIEYSAIKSGIISITKYLAKYYKNNNIRVNCISPGGILDSQPEEFLEKYKKSCASKGMLNSEDLIGTIVYLISDMSKYLNGQNIIVDDGWTL